eukprot:scaffold223_cov408-Prasinococcus_capsulatus_cf.AAC.12
MSSCWVDATTIHLLEALLPSLHLTCRCCDELTRPRHRGRALTASMAASPRSASEDTPCPPVTRSGGHHRSLRRRAV